MRSLIVNATRFVLCFSPRGAPARRGSCRRGSSSLAAEDRLAEYATGTCTATPSRGRVARDEFWTNHVSATSTRSRGARRGGRVRDARRRLMVAAPSAPLRRAARARAPAAAAAAAAPAAAAAARAPARARRRAARRRSSRSVYGGARARDAAGNRTGPRTAHAARLAARARRVVCLRRVPRARARRRVARPTRPTPRARSPARPTAAARAPRPRWRRRARRPCPEPAFLPAALLRLSSARCSRAREPGRGRGRGRGRARPRRRRRTTAAATPGEDGATALGARSGGPPGATAAVSAASASCRTTRPTRRSSGRGRRARFGVRRARAGRRERRFSPQRYEKNKHALNEPAAVSRADLAVDNDAREAESASQAFQDARRRVPARGPRAAIDDGHRDRRAVRCARGRRTARSLDRSRKARDGRIDVAYLYRCSTTDPGESFKGTRERTPSFLF